MLNTLRSYCTKPVIVKSSPWLIFLIAFGVRAAYAVVGSPGLTFDEPYYDHIASQLASGNGFTFAFSAWFTSIPNEPTSVQEPLYPLVLALLKILFGSDDYMSARIFQAIIGALIPVIVVIWGEKIFSREIGILAGGILAFYPPLIYFGRLLMTEALYTLLLIGAISIISTHIQSKKRTNWLGGLIFGSACLTRSVLLVFSPFLIAWLLLFNPTRRKGLISAFFTLFGIVSVIAPWTLRNYLVHDAFVPISTKGGWNLYFYNYPIPNYDFNHRWDEISIPRLDNLTEVEREKEYARRATGFVLDNPKLIASFAVVKFVDFWNPFLNGELDGLSVFNIVSYGALTLLAFTGLFRRALQKNLHPSMILMWLLIGFYMIQAMVFTGGGKSRLPIEPLLVLLGSEILWIMMVWFRARFILAAEK